MGVPPPPHTNIYFKEIFLKSFLYFNYNIVTMKNPTFWSSLTFQLKKLFPAVEWLTFWRLHRSVSIFDKQDWSYPMTFQKLNVCNQFKCSMVQWYFGFKNPYSQLNHRLSVMFPKEFYINNIPQIPQQGLSRGRENYDILSAFFGRHEIYNEMFMSTFRFPYNTLSSDIIGLTSP